MEKEFNEVFNKFYDLVEIQILEIESQAIIRKLRILIDN